MTKKFTILAFICIAVLAVSEYFLLQEAFTNKRFPILLFCASGLIVSIVFFWQFYKKYRKALK